MLGLFVTPTVTAIIEALASAHVDGPLAVIGNARLAHALAAHHPFPVTPVALSPVALSPRLAKKHPLAIPSLDTISDRSLAAVIGVYLTSDPAWSTTLRTWMRVIRDGGLIAFVDRGHPFEASRRALCAGLTELEQRHAGRAIITSGLITHLGTV